MKKIVRLKSYEGNDENPVLLKEKEEAAEFYHHLLKGFIAILLPLAAALVLGKGEKIPWPGFIRIAASILALLEWALLLYSLTKIIRLFKNKNETYGDRSRRIAYARYFEYICAGLACQAIPIIIEYTGTDSGVPYPWAEVLENLKKSWFQILALGIILGNIFYRMKNRKYPNQK